MYVIEHRVPYTSKAATFNLWFIGDVHVGAAGWAKDKFERTLKEVERDKTALVILMGDLADAILPADKRFDIHGVHPMFQHRLGDLADAEYEYLEKVLAPIQSKIVGILTGNHEEVIRLRWYRDLTRDLCRRLRVPYLGYDAIIGLVFRRKNSGSQRFIIRAHHGRGGGRTIGGRLEVLYKLSQSLSADIFVMGHVHSLIFSVRRQVVPNWRDEDVDERRRIFGITGSYLKSFVKGVDSYSEKADYPLNDLGCLKVQITPYHRIMAPEIHVL